MCNSYIHGLFEVYEVTVYPKLSLNYAALKQTYVLYKKLLSLVSLESVTDCTRQPTNIIWP